MNSPTALADLPTIDMTDLAPFHYGDERDAPPAADADYPDTETECQAELAHLETAFQARAKAERKRFELATDSEYWVAICFQSRAQKEAFLGALDLLRHGDKYLDGRLLAKKLNIGLPDEAPHYNISARPDPKLIELT